MYGQKSPRIKKRKPTGNVRGFKTLAVASIVIKGSKSLGLAIPSMSIEIPAQLLTISLFIGSLLCFGLMLREAHLQRPMRATKLNDVWRFIIFCFGASTPWLVGRKMNNSYRGLLGPIFKIWHHWFYKGYLGFGRIEIWSDTIVDGLNTPYRPYFNILSFLIFEIVVWVGVRLSPICFGMKATSIKNVMILNLSLTFLVRSIYWINQYLDIAEKQGQGYDYNIMTIDFIVGSVVAVYLLLEVVIGLFVFYKNAFVVFRELKEAKKEEEQESDKPEAEESSKDSKEFAYKHGTGKWKLC